MGYDTVGVSTVSNSTIDDGITGFAEVELYKLVSSSEYTQLQWQISLEEKEELCRLRFKPLAMIAIGEYSSICRNNGDDGMGYLRYRNPAMR